MARIAPMRYAIQWRFIKLDDLTHLDLRIRTSSLLCYQLLMVLWLLEQLYPEQTSMVGLSKSWV